MDGFGSHVYSYKSLEMLKKNKIKAIRMPSHTSSALQPLDVVVFRPLKALFNLLVKAWLAGNSVMTKFDVLRLFHKVGFR